MIRFLLSRPVAVSMFFLAVVILGGFSFQKLAIEGQPDTKLPQLVASTSWPNTSPEVIQVFLTSPIEEAGAQIAGLEEIESSSSRGNSTVVFRFNRDTNMEFARLDLNERLSKLRADLPPGSLQPQIRMTEGNTRADEFFMRASISGSFDMDRLTEIFNDYLRNEISGVDGVADVQIQGERQRALKIRLDRASMDLYDLVPQTVLSKVSELTTKYGASRSSLGNTEYTINIENTIPDITEVETLIVAKYGDQLVRINDVGTIELGSARVYSHFRLNGNPNLGVSIEKEVGANVIQTASDVRQRVADVLPHLPEGFRLDWLEDEGKMMGEQLQSVYMRGFWCIVLIICLLLIFLRSASAAMVITLNILFSVLITINFMYYFGVTFNIVTLSGLAIGFGMLVDNAIVVLENIFRHRELGKSKSEAAIAGASEVLWAILAATLTTVAAFLCMKFLEDRLAVTYWPLALAVIFSLSASLLVSFTFTPLLSLLIRGNNLKSKADDAEPKRTVLSRMSRGLGKSIQMMTDGYGQAVLWTLRHKMLVFLVVGAFTFMFYQVFFTQVDKGGFNFFFGGNDRLNVVVRMPEGAELETSNEVIRQFEERLLMIDGFKDVSVQVSNTLAYMSISFDNDALRTAYPLALKSRLISVAQGFSGVGLSVFGINNEDDYHSGSTGYESYNSSVRLLGYNYKRLMDYAEEITKTVKRNRRVKTTRIETSSQFSWRSQQTETVMLVDREKLRNYDIDISYLMAFLQRNLQTETRVPTKYKGEEMSLEVKFSDSDDFDLTDLERLIIKTPSNQQIHLMDLVSISERKVSSGIDRKDQQYMITVKWDYKGSSKRARKFNEAVYSSLELPPGFKAELDYSENLSEDENRNLWFVFILAIVIVFMIMASLYESIFDPIIIILTIPLAGIGVSWIYWFTANSFDSTAYIGLIILAGIVVNNSILLVSHINQEVRLMPETGMSFNEAVTKACKDRLRPILLTAITTIVGLLPLLEEFVNAFFQLPLMGLLRETLMGQAEAGQAVNVGLETTLGMFSSLSRSTVGGMLTATISTLLVIPMVYSVIFRGKQWLNQRINEVVALFRRKDESISLEEASA